MDLEQERVFYIHDGNCSEKNFTELIGTGIFDKDGKEKKIKRCLDCSGIFDEEGKGVAVTDKVFDAWRK